MNNERKKELLGIYKEWIHSTLCTWEDEIGAWDDLLEDGALTIEEWEWITANLNYEVNVFEM